MLRVHSGSFEGNYLVLELTEGETHVTQIAVAKDALKGERQAIRLLFDYLKYGNDYIQQQMDIATEIRGRL